MVQHSIRFSAISDHSILKYQNSVCHHLYNTNIMCYKNHCRMIFFSHEQKLFHHLFLNCYIQCTGWLICKKQIRMHDHGCTDSYSLVHSSGKFKRITVQHTFTVVQTNLLHNLSCTFPCLLSAYLLML